MPYKDDTLCGMFQNQANRYGDRYVFLMGKFDKEGRPTNTWRSITWKEAQDEVMDFAAGLMVLGLKKGERVAVFSESRPRWIIADQSIQSCGAIGVPLYPTLTKEELAFMLNDSGSSFVITSTQEKALMTIQALGSNANLKALITMGPWEGTKPQNVYTFTEVMDIGKRKGDRKAVEESIQSVKPDDIASIIYTSGTTGRQKGAILTQKNWVSNIYQSSNSTLLKKVRELDLHLISLVHLPLCHVYGRTADYHTSGLRLGGILAFAESFDTVPKNLLEIRPNVVVSIPRFFEKTYDLVRSTFARQNPFYRKLFNWSVRQGEKFTNSMATGTKLPVLDLLKFSVANILVFNRLKKSAGLDRLVLAVSGGGKLSKEVCVFIRSMGIQLNEGYGLTETSPVINFNEPEFRDIDVDNLGWFKKKMVDWTVDLMITQQAKGKSPYTNPIRSLKLSIAYNTVAYRLMIKPGTVGKPALWTEEKIAEDGEILVKGPQVFKGYWNMPEETKEAFTEDGWFKTGDIGEFDEDGYLTITDRKKELFVTSGGKNIAPHPIELALTAKQYIDQACLVGDGRKYISALIVPDFKELKMFAEENGITFTNNKDLIENPKVKELIKKQVDEVNERLARYEQIKYFTILDTPFTVETGELTPTLKLKRRVINQKYKDVIESMYKDNITQAV
ncbi:MAG: AMP-dependent synthetase/ligase [bacterium]